MKWPVKVSLGLVLILTGCASDPATRPLPDFQGMLYDLDSQPVAGVRLRWWPEGSTAETARETRTDLRGRFTLPRVAPGAYQFSAEKPGYEPRSWTWTLAGADTAGYLRMASQAQLWNLAMQALREQNWQEARRLLDRADRIDAQARPGQYLRALLAFRTGDAAASLRILEGLAASVPEDMPAVLLLQADLYEGPLGDPTKAVEILRRYLKLRTDPDIEARLARLTPAP